MLLAVASPPLLPAYESDCEGREGVAGVNWWLEEQNFDKREATEMFYDCRSVTDWSIACREFPKGDHASGTLHYAVYV